jgi:hypothetical protein
MLDFCLGHGPVQFRVGKFPYAIVGTHLLDRSIKLFLNLILEFPDSSTASYFVFRGTNPIRAASDHPRRPGSIKEISQ